MRFDHSNSLGRRLAAVASAALLSTFAGAGIAFASSRGPTASSATTAHVKACTPKAGKWFCVSFGGTSDSPTITIDGSNFGDLGTPVPAGCGTTGSDYPYDNLYMQNVSRNYNGGQQTSSPNGSLDCLGLILSNDTSTQIAFTFGSGYTPAVGFTTGNKFVIGEVDGVVGSRACFATVPTYPATVKCLL